MITRQTKQDTKITLINYVTITSFALGESHLRLFICHCDGLVAIETRPQNPKEFPNKQPPTAADRGCDAQYSSSSVSLLNSAVGTLVWARAICLCSGGWRSPGAESLSIPIPTWSTAGGDEAAADLHSWFSHIHQTQWQSVEWKLLMAFSWIEVAQRTCIWDARSQPTVEI